MNSAYMTVFTVLAVLLTVVDFNYCRQAYLKTGKIAQYLGLSSFAAGAVTASYLVSLLAGSYTVMSVASSIYFASIDWMLVSLVLYAYHFTQMHLNWGAKLIRRAICGYALFDSAVMFVNIFNEITVSFARPAENPLAPYVYQMKPLYVMHLVFTYILVVFVLYILRCHRDDRGDERDIPFSPDGLPLFHPGLVGVHLQRGAVSAVLGHLQLSAKRYAQIPGHDHLSEYRSGHRAV